MDFCPISAGNLMTFNVFGCLLFGQAVLVFSGVALANVRAKKKRKKKKKYQYVEFLKFLLLFSKNIFLFFSRARLREELRKRPRLLGRRGDTRKRDIQSLSHETIPGKSLLKADAPTAERVAPCLYRTSQPKEVYPSLTKGKGRYSPGTMPAAPSRSTRAREANQKR